MSDKRLKDFQINDSFTGCFALRQCQKRTKNNGEPFLAMELGDSSGRLPAVYWEADAGEIFEQIADAKVVYIVGIITEFRDKPQVTVREIRIPQSEEFDADELLPKGDIPPEKLAIELRNIIETVSDEWFSALLAKIFGDEEILRKFLETPAGKLWHGAYVGGLAEHSINVAKICELTASFFPVCRREPLIAGALLHDLGKIEELSADSHFDYTAEGRLIGHIVLGYQRVRSAIASIDGFPKGLADEIFHMILSHHGDGDKGSPVPPITLEASILHHADALESQANAFKHVIERDMAKPGEFSEWVRPVGRFLFIDHYRGGEE